MLKIQEIREIIKLIDQSSIEKFSFESEGTKLVLKKGNSGEQVTCTRCGTDSTCTTGNHCARTNSRSNHFTFATTGSPSGACRRSNLK